MHYKETTLFLSKKTFCLRILNICSVITKSSEAWCQQIFLLCIKGAVMGSYLTWTWWNYFCKILIKYRFEINICKFDEASPHWHWPVLVTATSSCPGRVQIRIFGAAVNTDWTILDWIQSIMRKPISNIFFINGI